MEHKIFDPQWKYADGDSGSGGIEGYASTFANWDSMYERPVPGAFKRHLADFLRDGFITVGHDWSSLPVATPIEAREDGVGLWIAAAFHTTAMAQAARTVVKERLERGKSVKLSIGFQILADEYTEEGRLLREIKLFEFSLVNVPANSQADVVGAKSDSQPLINHYSAVHAAVEGFASRARAIQTLRAKEGRVLSSDNRARIEQLLTALDSVRSELHDLLASSEPKSAAKTHALYAEFLAIEARINGVFL